MTARQLRTKYLKFFEEKEHSPFPSAPLVPYDVMGRIDESLLFTGAGMVQFKPFFRGLAKPPHPRLTTSQKCVRTGDIETVGDLSHLTFFEMLGNFSFGDYFKQEAIKFSWEFLTGSNWLALDPKRLSFTVFQDDDEAYDAWAECLRTVGIEPANRIFRLGEETNYWPAGAFSSGPPGPCGPNSEMFYWTDANSLPPSGTYTVDDYLNDESQGRWLEVWNDVFIQFEWQGQLRDPQSPALGYEKSGMPELPFRSIDTGMGLERTSCVLGGKQSVYDIDVFEPIFEKIQSLSGLKYGAALPTDTAMRVVADHIRTACFCIADGILPKNDGRGYVLRRLIRRAVLKGQRVLGFKKPFFHQVYAGVVDAMGEHYTELVDNRGLIEETLQNEEALFRRTLDAGVTRLSSELERIGTGGKLDGAYAFNLYHTYGFPKEVTQELCEEAAIEFDTNGFDRALDEARRESQEGSDIDTVYGNVAIHFEFAEKQTPTSTEFVGYGTPRCEAIVQGALPELLENGLCTGRVALALDKTPFYAESGGQVSDTGRIVGENFEFRVVDLVKQSGVYVHLCEPVRLLHPAPLLNMPADEATNVLLHQVFNHRVLAEIDLPSRLSTMRNHTATHIMQAVLRNKLGTHVTQAGSLVSPEHLRFDFTHSKALEPEELAEIEYMVNDQILRNMPVTTYVDMPIAEARAKGAMALFGEKYGDRVRMVEIGEFSRELCGGTHVSATGEIGMLKIIGESSVGSGVRRIEAITGAELLNWMWKTDSTLKGASSILKTTPKELVPAIERVLDQVREERKKREKLMQQGAGAAEATSVSVGSVTLSIQKMTTGEAKDAQLVADRLTDSKPNVVAVVALVTEEGKVTFVAKIGNDALAAGVHAGNLVREIAKVAGGGGGGKADFATAGGRDANKVDDALAIAASTIQGMLS
jgi:alanyl-tRNA synthetase